MLVFKKKWPLARVNIAQVAIFFIASGGLSFAHMQSTYAQTAAASASKPMGYAPKGAASAPARAASVTAPAGAASAPAAAASAPPANPIVSTYQAQKRVKDAKGRETYEPLKSLSPGDVVRYTGFHKNTGPYNLLDVNLGVGIPQGLVVLPGGTTPETGKLIGPAGGAQQMQWNLAVLESGATQTVTLMLQVPGAAPAPKPVSSGALNIRKSDGGKGKTSAAQTDTATAPAPAATTPTTNTPSN
jgi:hypothetical protein